jgi:hypothetical protein
MSRKFTYYYGQLAAPLKAKVQEGTGKGQCAAGEGRCEEHPTKEQWQARQKAANVDSLHMDIVDKAEEDAVTLEEYNAPDFNKFFSGWTLTVDLRDAKNGDIISTQVYENIRDRRTATEIVMTFPHERGTFPEGDIVNTNGQRFNINPFEYKKLYTLEERITHVMSQRRKESK